MGKTFGKESIDAPSSPPLREPLKAPDEVLQMKAASLRAGLFLCEQGEVIEQITSSELEQYPLFLSLGSALAKQHESPLEGFL